MLMKDTVVINSYHIQVKQYRGQRVVTFRDIDFVHNRPVGTAKRNFNANKNRFIENEDYYKICQDEIRTNNIEGISNKCHKDVVLITEGGYMMLVKSFTDDLSWEIQRKLVKSYFRRKQVQQEQQDDFKKLYDYFDKTFCGEPVLTIADVHNLIGVKRATINWYLNKYLEHGRDFRVIRGDNLIKYKTENPKTLRNCGSSFIIITKTGFNKICKAYGVFVEEPKCFEDKKEVTKPTVKKMFSDFQKCYNLEKYVLTEDIDETDIKAFAKVLISLLLNFDN